MKALSSPGSIDMSSLTTATQAFDIDQSFSYFLFPINEISDSLAASSCSGAVIFWNVFPIISPFRISFIS